MKEVMFFIHSYEDFMNCTNEKLQTVISALNAVDTERYNQVKMQYPDFTWQPQLIEISTLVTLIQRAYPAQVVEYTLGRKISSSGNGEKPKEEETPGLFPPTKQKANNVYNENFRNFNEDQLIGEVTSKDRGSYQPPDMNDHIYRSRSRSPETSSHRERNRYDATDRRSRHNSYASRSDNNYNNNLTSSQCLEVKLFLDKIPYFDGSNNKEALNFLAQCEEAAEKMKASEVTIAWSKLAGRADRIMREETRQHEGVLTWELFQATLIEHFYHIPSKERAASLLSRLQQDAHESIGDYVQRSSEIIQVHSGKTNLKEIASSQYGWNLVQGLTNISIKNKIADCIAICQSLSDVCKLVKQVRREMENREAFTGISAEVEENIEEVNWKQRSFSQKGGNNYRGNFRGRYDKTGYNHRGRGYSYGSGYNKTGQQVGTSYQMRKVGNRKYRLNPEGYLAQGIIPLDLVHSFDKTPRTLYIPIINTTDKYKSIAKGSLLGTFEPIDESINEIRETNWTELDRRMRQAHQQLRKKKSYRKARQEYFKGQENDEKLLPDYPADSNMEMETMMKRSDTVLEDSKDADK